MTTTIDEDGANYRIGKMYLDAGKWKDAFPFLVKAANNAHADATSSVIKNYSLSSTLSLKSENSEILEYISEQKQFLKSNKGPVSNYFLGKIGNKSDNVKRVLFANSFILSKYERALLYYYDRLYFFASELYVTIIERFDFEYLSKEEQGAIYNDLSLCGWYTENKDMFCKYNLLAQQLDYPISFSNWANGYLHGTLICSQPNYDFALFWFKEALSKFPSHYVNNIKYAKEKIQYCKDKLAKMAK